MQVTYREEYREFAARHSVSGEPIRFRNWILFPDGASVMAENADARSEPSADMQQRLTAIRDYHKAWIERLRKDQNRRAALAGMQWELPPPELDTDLAVKIAAHERKLAEVEGQFAPNPQLEMQRLLRELETRQFAESVGPWHEQQQREAAHRQEERDMAVMIGHPL